MRYIVVSIDTSPQEIDRRCEELTALGAGGCMIESEDDFQDFLDENRQYWDYVDEGLEQAFKGVSRVTCYLTDDEEGEATLARIMAAFPQAHSDYTEDKDWENDWRNYYEPIEVGNRIVVVPEWMDAPSDGRVATG